MSQLEYPLKKMRYLFTLVHMLVRDVHWLLVRSNNRKVYKETMPCDYMKQRKADSQATIEDIVEASLKMASAICRRTSRLSNSNIRAPDSAATEHPDVDQIVEAYNTAAGGTDEDREKYWLDVGSIPLNTEMPEIAALGGAASIPTEIKYRVSESGALFKLVVSETGKRFVMPEFAIRTDKAKFLRMSFASNNWPQKGCAKYHRIRRVEKPALVDYRGNGVYTHPRGIESTYRGKIEFSSP